MIGKNIGCMAKFQGMGIIMIWVKVFIEVGCINVRKSFCCHLFSKCIQSVGTSPKMSSFQDILAVSLIPVYERSLKLHSLELSC